MKIRYNVISYMRIVACLWITLGHYAQVFELPTVFEHIVVGPVVIFFVISGFLAYESLKEEGNLVIGEYYIKRIKRIVPSYYIVLFLCMLSQLMIIGVDSNTLSFNWLRYFTFLNMLIPSYDYAQWNGLNGYWTMGCFPIFYAIAPFLKKWMKTWKNSVALLIGSMGLMYVSKTLILVFAHHTKWDGIEAMATLNPLSTLYLFLLGMIAAYACHNGCEKDAAVVFGVLFLSMLTLGKGGYVLWGIGSACICLRPSCTIEMEGYKVWTTVVKWLDKNSFNVYLVHMLVANTWLSIQCDQGLLGSVCCILITFLLANTVTHVAENIVR